ncbi:MAG: hypothetical protein HYR67_03060 [Bacteroidetes bacterium]|nr:hypothetical protein [Bacteroidota bacterium]
MKKVFLLCSILIGTNGFAQTMEQTMEKRAREFHRVIGLDDKGLWKKFIEENYTKALIEKPMRAKTVKQGEEGQSSESKEIKGTIEDKLKIFQQLHDDFNGAKIVSIKPNGENLEMELSKGDFAGTFKFKFDKNKPYFIDGISIQAEGGER